MCPCLRLDPPFCLGLHWCIRSRLELDSEGYIVSPQKKTSLAFHSFPFIFTWQRTVAVDLRAEEHVDHLHGEY